MRNWKQVIALLAVVAFAAILPMSAFADNDKNENKGKNVQEEITDENTNVDEDEIDEDTDESDVEDELNNGNNKNKAWKAAKDAVQQKRADLRAEREKVQLLLNDLTAQLEAAEAANNTTEIERLKAEIEKQKAERDAIKAEMKLAIKEMQQIMKEKYTQEELDQLDKIANEIEDELGIEVLPVTNIFVKDKDVKFDVPPVIKEGRTLIPLRAIAQSTGAIVQWNSETKEVTITKENPETNISFKIGDDFITINGTKTMLDVPAQNLKSRTVVPLRFIVENLALKVNWDAETKTIDIAE